MLQEETVGVTTSPVTHVDVVAVKRASINGVASPLAELIGNESNIVPINIVIKKLSKTMWVVDSDNFGFFTTKSPP